MKFCEIYKAGEAGYYVDPSPEADTIVVFADNKKYIYDASAFSSARDFKAFAWTAFSNAGRNRIKITGRYPTYQIETTV